MGSSIRFIALCGALGMALAPGFVSAGDEKRMSRRQTCNRLTHQIEHFEGSVLKMARERNDDLWEQSTQQHVQLLRSQRAAKCPKHADEEKILAKARAQAEAMRAMMKAAAKGAAKYFSGGWY